MADSLQVPPSPSIVTPAARPMEPDDYRDFLRLHCCTPSPKKPQFSAPSSPTLRSPLIPRNVSEHLYMIPSLDPFKPLSPIASSSGNRTRTRSEQYYGTGISLSPSQFSTMAGPSEYPTFSPPPFRSMFHLFPEVGVPGSSSLK
jgi:hypothetical protein